ncbi:hypothetical protein [Marinobacter caseinilyticus]|uniref:hypothetical protein n=1 Tax=Marinobacter caseinilyticus TaxID=2692195 RepID=UPI001F397204|nr:hypothetical protein [Marinobacter caseinilyticus]
MSLDQFGFRIRRLVLVDSAGFCYVEIPVDEHAVILGTGNLGKSSLLNSLRLFLLPETNFRNSRKKFSFRNASAGSYYTNEESYQHYFPGQYSFLIMEAENPAGVHCQILYRDRSSDLSYGRLFVPAAYDDLRPLFWTMGDDHDGIGHAVSGLSVSKVAESVKKLSAKAVVTNDTNKLKSMLYSSDLMSPDAVRYSVLPLADGDERKVQSLRTLILLLFEMKADDRAMADAVASIIEADKKFADDAFDFDIDQFLLRHEELKSQNEHLIRIESERPRFGKLTQSYQRLHEVERSQSEFAAFRAGLAQALEQSRSAHQQANNARADLKETHRHASKQLQDQDDRLKELNGEIKTHRKNLSKAEDDQCRGELMMSQYAGMSRDEVHSILTEELEAAESQLRALKNAAQAQVQTQRLNAQINAVDERLKKLIDRQQRQKWQLHHQLEDAVLQPLQAVDSRLALASPGKALDDATRATIRAFTELFRPQGEGFEWFDTVFERRDLHQEDLEAERRKLSEERRELQRRLDELAGGDNEAFDRPRKVADTEKEVQAAKQDLELLDRLPAATITGRDAETGINECEKVKAEAEQALSVERERLDAVSVKLARAESDLRHVVERENEFIQLNKTVGSLQHRIPVLASAVAEVPLTPEALTVVHLDDIGQRLEALIELRHAVLNHLRHFVLVGILEDGDGQLQLDSPPATDIRDAFQRLGEAFSELAEQEQLLTGQIKAHNETVASYRLALKANHEHIRRFENQLNGELDGVTINDLVEIRVDIHTDPKFRNLVEESDAIDPYSDQLQSDAFYDRLRVFVAEFFTDQSQGYRLTMDRVITGVSYRTRKRNGTGLDTKGQSTSTTALINLELVHRLLRRVLYPGVRLSFPMVLDELASIDVSQMPSLLERLKAQGFNLFSAATHSASPEVIYQVGRHLEVGQMRTAKPYDARRTLVFWGGAEGFRRSDGEHWVDQTQSGLWDSTEEPAKMEHAVNAGHAVDERSPLEGESGE